jgi:hypothetical protein
MASSSPQAHVPLLLGLSADALCLVSWIVLVVLERNGQLPTRGSWALIGLVLLWSVATTASRWVALRDAPPEALSRLRTTARVSSVMCLGGLVALSFLLGLWGSPRA